MKETIANSKLSEPRIHTLRFRKLMQQIRLMKMLDKAKITHKKDGIIG
jgi:hypothetical protein